MMDAHGVHGNRDGCPPVLCSWGHGDGFKLHYLLQGLYTLSAALIFDTGMRLGRRALDTGCSVLAPWRLPTSCVDLSSLFSSAQFPLTI
jgi:hypothetical protein